MAWNYFPQRNSKLFQRTPYSESKLSKNSRPASVIA